MRQRGFGAALAAVVMLSPVAACAQIEAAAPEALHPAAGAVRAAAQDNPPPAPPAAGRQDDGPVVIDEATFAAWLADLKAEAGARGLTAPAVQQALAALQPRPKVIEYDRRQPEFSQTFWTYAARAVSPQRVEKGREMLRQHAALLAAVEKDYGVQPRFLVAFWGLETNYGANFGGFPVIDALATLAYDERRAAFFRGELMEALAILQAGHIAPERMVGSWAGAMGHLQFMPSTFRRHAVDRTGDGRADIWGSLPDVFASAAKYLADEGWKGDQTWGREVRLPDGFDLEHASLSVRKPLAEWAALGVRKADGGALPVVAGIDASVILPAGVRGPAFLVYDNYRTTMVWNRSILYATAIGLLADQLAGLPPMQAKAPPDARPLSRGEVVEIQTRLNALGFEVGEPDGMAGPRTRSALRAFQKSVGMPADGYADPVVLERLRAEEARAATPAAGGN